MTAKANDETKRVLLISNSTLHGGGYLDHAEAEIRSFLGTNNDSKPHFIYGNEPPGYRPWWPF
ncbi:MAG: hypothetical protein M3Y84_11945 [Acidobacteriota bacterium]|nr:hypothetical protein [Acidobacteriota bacterium]